MDLVYTIAVYIICPIVVKILWFIIKDYLKNKLK